MNIDEWTMMKDDLEKLEQENAEELEQFDQQLQDELPVQYRKVSKEALLLRHQQKAMTSAKRYKEAKAYKKEAEKLEQEELKKQ